MFPHISPSPTSLPHCLCHCVSVRGQEPITRSEQLNYFRATAFSQVRLFLDTPFPPKISVSGDLRIEISVNKKWRPNAVVFASVFRFPLVVFHHSNPVIPKTSLPTIPCVLFCIFHILCKRAFGTFLRVRVRSIESTL